MKLLLASVCAWMVVVSSSSNASMLLMNNRSVLTPLDSELGPPLWIQWCDSMGLAYAMVVEMHKLWFAYIVYILIAILSYGVYTKPQATSPRNVYGDHPTSRGPHPQYPERYPVSSSETYWNQDLPGYKPTVHIDPIVLKFDCTKREGGWADPEDHLLVDFTQRCSYCGPIQFDSNGRPRNPIGRTGMCDRGLLGKWGPNYAADPIVTRYHPETGLLQLVVIKRVDTGEWALPGGMVDAGEHVTDTVRREFQEEAVNVGEEHAHEYQHMLDELFDHRNACTVYKGYVDDPRNTDNAWMETAVMHFHCSSELGRMIPLTAGDDAAQVQWLTIEDFDSLQLYASHAWLVKLALDTVATRISK